MEGGRPLAVPSGQAHGRELDRRGRGVRGLDQAGCEQRPERREVTGIDRVVDRAGEDQGSCEVVGVGVDQGEVVSGEVGEYL